MKKIEVILLVLTMCFSVSHAVAQNNSPGKHINFDHAWKFHLGHAQNPEKDFNYGLSSLFAKTGEARGTCIDVNFDDSEWEDVTLPHDWAVSLPFVMAISNLMVIRQLEVCIRKKVLAGIEKLLQLQKQILESALFCNLTEYLGTVRYG